MAKIRQGYQFFTSSDLRTIKSNTNRNNHSDNYLFIAKKINWDKKEEFEEIVKENEKAGYLVNNERQYKLLKEMRTWMVENMNPEEYRAVESRT